MHLLTISTTTEEKSFKEYIEVADTVLQLAISQIEKEKEFIPSIIRKIFLDTTYMADLDNLDNDTKNIAIEFSSLLKEYYEEKEKEKLAECFLVAITINF